MKLGHPQSPITATFAGRGAFTLVEMLVSMSVLILLVAFLAQVVNMTTQSASTGKDRGELDARCRMVLNVIGNDLSRMLKRPDLDCVFSKVDGNDEFFFFSEVAGNAPVQTGTALQGVSVVGCRVRPEGGLLRMGKALGWSKAAGSLDSVVYLPNTIRTQWPITVASRPVSSTDPDFNLIGSEIFRLEFCFVDKTGAYVQPTATWVANGLKEISAVVVTIAALNTSALQLLSDTELARLRDAFPDAKDEDLAQARLAGDSWQRLVTSGSLSFPAPVAQRVRVYERVYWLNH